MTDAWLSSSAASGSDGRTRVTVCHSSNGGQQWTTVGRFAAIGSAQAPQFIDSAHGWLVTFVTGGSQSPSDVHLFSTSNGGHRWRQVAAHATGVVAGHSFGRLPGACGANITFSSATTGWYFGGCGQGGGVGERSPRLWANYLAVSHDGGRHWTPVTVPHPRIRHQRSGCRAGAACTFTPVLVRPRLIEFTAGGPGSLSNVLYRSTNGGHTWQVEPLPLPNTNVGTADGTHLLQLSDTAPRVYVSDNSGRRWHRIDTNLPRPAFEGPYVVNRRAAFAFLLHNRPLYRTNNHGRTWARVDTHLVRQ